MSQGLETKEKGHRDSIGMFDFSRGFLMLFEIWGHTVILFLNGWVMGNERYVLFLPLLFYKFFIYGLVPMFFMMSGYSFRQQSMKRCINNRVKHLLKPYLGVAVIVTVLAVLKKVIQGEGIMEALKYQTFPFLIGLSPGNTNVTGWYTASIGPMWFILVLALAWIVLNLVFKLENEVLRAVCIITMVAFSTRLPFYAFMPLCIAQTLCCIGYIYIGYCMKQADILSKDISKKTYMVLWTIQLVIMLFGSVDMSQNVWKLGFLDYVGSCIAGFLVFMILTNRKQIKGKIARITQWAGRNSLYVLCIHSIEFLVFPWEKVVSLFGTHRLVGIFAITFVRAAIVLVGCYVLEKYLKWKRHRRVVKKRNKSGEN